MANSIMRNIPPEVGLSGLGQPRVHDPIWPPPLSTFSKSFALCHLSATWVYFCVIKTSDGFVPRLPVHMFLCFHMPTRYQLEWANDANNASGRVHLAFPTCWLLIILYLFPWVNFFLSRTQCCSSNDTFHITQDITWIIPCPGQKTEGWTTTTK